MRKYAKVCSLISGFTVVYVIRCGKIIEFAGIIKLLECLFSISLKIRILKFFFSGV